MEDNNLSTELKLLKIEVRELKADVNEIKVGSEKHNDRIYNLLESSLKQQNTNTLQDKAFYKKLLIGCFSVLGTITLAAFGIKQIINIF